MSTQHMEALRRANVIRSARSFMRRRIGEADRSLSPRLAAGVVLEVPPEAESMPAFDLLKSINGYGVVRARKVLRAAGVPEHRDLASLTDRQRAALAERLSP